MSIEARNKIIELIEQKYKKLDNYIALRVGIDRYGN